MDDDTLERLMIDRALGALPADTEALLAAYIEHQPQAAGAALGVTGLDQTISLARQALAAAAPPVLTLPRFPKAKFARTQRMRRFRLAAVQAAALAACVLLGFGVGGFGSQTPSPSPPERAQLLERPQPVATVTIRPRAETTGSTDRSTFWSARAWYERSTRDRPSPERRLIWDSVVKWPRMGDS